VNPHYPLVAERAAHRCEYCHAPEAIFNFPFEVEHIIPPLHGGRPIVRHDLPSARRALPSGAALFRALPT
jgi:hypothetical protein